MSRDFNPETSYDAAIRRLTSDPNSPAFQHQAVLALARAGSLDFALAEFARYGLDKVRCHEDIQGLGGRLEKDLFLASSGAGAQKHARRSAELYTKAYEDTGGYYSGINAATMAMLSGAPAENYQAKARQILEDVPHSGFSPETKYYIEATRAEAHLLLGAPELAKEAMRRGWDHDPLNFTAHASTLKQFRLIQKALGLDLNWLRIFEPPKAIHFAGHLFGVNPHEPSLLQESIESLREEISELIQIRDIGFGYGALAAGSDILIAEVMIEEGGELHVILPVSKELFKAKSVTPFGSVWEVRFEACLDQASSVEIVSESTHWPDEGLDRFTGRIAMGHAVMRARHLSVSAEQLVIWDGKEGATGTAADALIWQQSGRKQHVISYTGTRAGKPAPQTDSQAYEIILAVRGQDSCERFDTIEAAATAALALKDGAGLAIGLRDHGMDPESLSRKLAARAVPGGVLMSEGFAGHLALREANAFTGDYMGRIDVDLDGPRVFALKAASSFE